jgi:hypothetical protein
MMLGTSRDPFEARSTPASQRNDSAVLISAGRMKQISVVTLGKHGFELVSCGRLHAGWEATGWAVGRRLTLALCVVGINMTTTVPAEITRQQMLHSKMLLPA